MRRTTTETMKNLYLGEFHYFATGEGSHTYLAVISAETKDDALNIFIDKTVKKWYPVQLHNEQSRKFVSYGCKATPIKEVTLENYDGALKSILESVIDIIKKGGMGDNGFEYYLSFNLS